MGQAHIVPRRMILACQAPHMLTQWEDVRSFRQTFLAGSQSVFYENCEARKEANRMTSVPDW